MTDPTNPVATAKLEIDARPEVVYGLITDLPTLASLAEQTVAMEWRKGSSVVRARCSSVATKTVAGGGPQSAP